MMIRVVRSRVRGWSAHWWALAAVLWCVLLPVAVAAEAADSPGPQGLWLGPDGAPLPWVSFEEAEAFLERAKVVSARRIGKGINNPLKVLLEKDGVRAHAVFRNVNVQRERARFRNGTSQRHFRDSALFEVAAYRLARLLGLANLPPTVPRQIRREHGSLQLWVENAMNEKERAAGRITPPDIRLWRTQMQHLRLFDSLISNSDRNAGNLLFDERGSLWMIDHTRSFRRNRDPELPLTFYQIERKVWERLSGADLKLWQQELGDFLTRQELRSLWARRGKIAEYFEGLIEARGERLVLLEKADATAGPLQPQAGGS